MVGKTELLNIAPKAGEYFGTWPADAIFRFYVKYNLGNAQGILQPLYSPKSLHIITLEYL